MLILHLTFALLIGRVLGLNVSYEIIVERDGVSISDQYLQCEKNACYLTQTFPFTSSVKLYRNPDSQEHFITTLYFEPRYLKASSTSCLFSIDLPEVNLQIKRIIAYCNDIYINANGVSISLSTFSFGNMMLRSKAPVIVATTQTSLFSPLCITPSNQYLISPISRMINQYIMMTKTLNCSLQMNPFDELTDNDLDRFASDISKLGVC